MKRMLLSFSQIVLSAVAVAFCLSCDQKEDLGGDTISHSELNQLMKADLESKNLTKRLEHHFRDNGYSFTLSYEGPIGEGSIGDRVSSVVSGPTLLICDGTTTKSEASRVESEIKSLLSSEESERLDRMYEIKPYDDRHDDGRTYIRAKYLRPFQTKAGEQGMGGQPATPPRIGD